MRKDKDEAINLRKEGKSYTEICKIMRVPKSTLSDWFKIHPWSEDIKKRLIEGSKQQSKIVLENVHKIRGEELSKIYKQAEEEATEDFELLKYHPLFISAMMIYWGEGDKLSKSRVSVANTEPAMLKVFIYFVRNMCSISEEKLRVWILAYPDMDLEQSKKYWIDNLGLKEGNFRKTTVIEGKSKTKRLKNGVCYVELHSTYFKIKMLVWLRRFSMELCSDEYYAGIV